MHHPTARSCSPLSEAVAACIVQHSARSQTFAPRQHQICECGVALTHCLLQVHVLCSSGASHVVCPLAPWGSVWPASSVQQLRDSVPETDGGRSAAWLNQVGFMLLAMRKPALPQDSVPESVRGRSAGWLRNQLICQQHAAVQKLLQATLLHARPMQAG